MISKFLYVEKHYFLPISLNICFGAKTDFRLIETVHEAGLEVRLCLVLFVKT